MLPKVFIFDVGGTLLKNLNFNFDNGLRYLYDEIFDVQESYDKFLEFDEIFHELYEEAVKIDIEIPFKALYNFLSFVYPLKTKLSIDEIEIEFSSRVYQIEIMDGVKEILDYLKSKDIKLYVLSNTLFSTNTINHEIGKIGLRDYFIDTLGTGDYCIKKPSDKIFKLYLKKLQDYPVSEIAYLGNEYINDVVTPVKLGMKVFFKNEELKEHDGYVEFDTYHNLVEWLKKHE